MGGIVSSLSRLPLLYAQRQLYLTLCHWGKIHSFYEYAIDIPMEIGNAVHNTGPHQTPTEALFRETFFFPFPSLLFPFFPFSSFPFPFLPFFSFPFPSFPCPSVPFLLWLSRCYKATLSHSPLISYTATDSAAIVLYFSPCTELVSSLFQTDARVIHKSYTTEFVLLYPQGLWRCWPLSANGSNWAERLFYMHLCYTYVVVLAVILFCVRHHLSSLLLLYLV